MGADGILPMPTVSSTPRSAELDGHMSYHSANRVAPQEVVLPQRHADDERAILVLAGSGGSFG